MFTIQSAFLIGSIAFVSAASPLPARYVVIVGGGLSDGTPLVTDVVNRRVPSASQALRVLVEPNVAPNVSVRWSSPDGKNGFGPSGMFVGGPMETYEATVGDYAGVYPRGHARGGAVVVADVGHPVDARATFYVRDVIGIGFGCYGFIANGPSVRIVDGIPEATSLAEADVAVVGPGEEREGPGYECWGENYLPGATSYRLIFRLGGRILSYGSPGPFVKELPYAAIDGTRPLDILSSGGRRFRLHISPDGGSYFSGWIEPIDDDGHPTDDI